MKKIKERHLETVCRRKKKEKERAKVSHFWYRIKFWYPDG